MSITQSSTRLAAVAAGSLLALGLVFGAYNVPAQAAGLSASQIQSILSLLSSFGADQTTINNVQASLNGLPTTGNTTTTTTTTSTGYNWTKNLQLGSTGADVKALQQFLNTDAATQVAATGAGSAGMETSTFGPGTKAAVMKFQKKYGISQTGTVGPLTRAQLNMLAAGTTTTGTGTTTTVGTSTASSLTVSAAVQPANQIVPAGVARAPFTKFTVTAPATGAVTINSVTVQRQGIAVDTDLAGVELLDQNGNQVGISRTLDSTHQAVIGAAVVVPAGTSQTFTVAGDTAAVGILGSGDVASLAVVAVNSSATINGSLPIVGASNTFNSTVQIGSITAQRGSNDPGSSNNENVGQTSYIFSSVRLTAGSAEDTYLKSIRWHQVGSASQSYLQNVVVLANGTSYPTTVSSDNYYTATFPGQGVLVQKGNSVDVAIQGDLLNGSNTNVEFDIQKRNDINVVGALYGYGILPAYTSSNTCNWQSDITNRGKVCASDDPYYEGFSATINSGTVTVSTSNSVSASNIAVNTQNQVLGGFQLLTQGEQVSVGKMVFEVSKTNNGTADATLYNSGTPLITSVSLVDQNGNVLGGPVDLNSLGQLVFSGTVTFPVGTTQLYLKGKIGTSFPSNGSVYISTNPGSDWSTITGMTTGRNLSLSSGMLISAGQTVKTQALTLSVSATPISQNVISGINQFAFANFVVDATASGEDVRVTTLPTTLTFGGLSAANSLVNCQVYNGATSISSTHVYNPNGATTSAQSINFTLDNGGIVVPKGTSVTLGVACDLRSGSAGTYAFGLPSSLSAWTGATGVTSGNTVVATLGTYVGPTMAASANGGGVTVAVDPSSPSYSVASAGATGVDLGHIKFSASNEAVDLRQVALVLASGNNYNLVNNSVALYDATTNTQVGTAVFSSGRFATSSAIASGAFRIPSNGSRTLVLKGDIAGVSVSGPATMSGALIQVAYDGNNVGINGNYGVGVSSGQTITLGTTGLVTPAGVQMYKSFPTFTYSTAGATATAGSNTLLSLTVAADSKGDVTLNKLTFLTATSSATLTGVTFTGPNGNVGTVTGPDANNFVTVLFNGSNTADAVIGAGTSKVYTLRGNVVLGNGGLSGSVATSLKGDTVSVNGTKTQAALSTSYIIWSPESTTTSVVGSTGMNDWTNGYGLGGIFQSAGLGQDGLANVIAK